MLPNTDLLIQALAEVFQPDAPVSLEQFKGRVEIVRDALLAVEQRGQHLMIFGDRGVGKTSLARAVKSRVEGSPKAHVFDAICEGASTFRRVWTRLLSSLEVVHERAPMGFGAKTGTPNRTSLGETLSEDCTAEEICDVVQRLDRGLVAIVDEFDVLARGEARRFSGLMKVSSDRQVDLTLILVGVANDISSLVEGHQSVERCLQQIHVGRMSQAETRQIIADGWATCGFRAETGVIDALAGETQGLPYLAHLLGQCAGNEAVRARADIITTATVVQAKRRALEKMQYTVAKAYEVAMNCCTAEDLSTLAAEPADSFGFFRTQDVATDTIDRLVCNEVLTREERTGRLRFVQPLLHPYIRLVLEGPVNGL